MNDNMQNKLIWVIVGLSILIFAVFGVGKLMTDKVADRVINKLQKEYSPSPYGPGMDPDKLNPPRAQPQISAPPQGQPSSPLVQPRTATWEEDWEKSRRD